MDTKTTSNKFWSPSTGFMSEGLTIESYDTDETVGVEDGSNIELENLEHQGLISYIKDRYERAKTKRRTDELRWLECYRNYRGIYGPEVRFTDTEKSRAFIKITKTKVLAAYAQIVDILLSSNKFPIGVEASKVPEGVEETVHVDPKDPAQQQGAPTSTVARPDILKSLGPVKELLDPVKDKVKEGPGLTPTSFTWEPAKEAAKKLEKKIHDQLEEAHADKSLRSFVFEMSLFGHGVYKGPFAKDKEYPKWSEDGTYEPVIKPVPHVEFVSIWDSYPDADATNMQECEYFVQRHRLNKTQLRQLKKRPYFRAESIEKAISEGYNYLPEYWEHELKDYENKNGTERFEVLEFWGIADAEIAEIAEMDIPEEFKGLDQVQINAWICNGNLLRLVFNPFTPARIPFHACPYELNPYSFFGIGIAENMFDTQLIMNGMFRLAIDNAAISSNVVFEINETLLAEGQDFKLFPGKVFRTTGGQPGQSIHVHKIDNITQELNMVFDKARQLADEATGMPSYAHGQGGIQGIGRTASGMSMLMGAAKENIKTVVRNIDDYLLVPLGKALFAFNMQFDFDKDFVGDLEVVAMGTTSLMRNEVRSQKVMQFLQITANPMDAPFVKRDYLLRELAEALDMDPEKVVNDPRAAGIKALQMQDLMRAQGIDPNKQQGQQQGGAPGVDDPTGTGGGNIAPGNAPVPEEQGFSGTPRGGSGKGNGQ